MILELALTFLHSFQFYYATFLMIYFYSIFFTEFLYFIYYKFKVLGAFTEEY